MLDLIDFLELVRLMGMVDFLGIPSGKCVWKVLEDMEGVQNLQVKKTPQLDYCGVLLMMELLFPVL
ncbi:MAG: hypothetical protein LIR25_03135 [bacterium]|nr:hypothetical protein [bacterium]